MQTSGTQQAKGIRHQPAGLPGRHPGHGRLRDQLLPPPARHREIVPHVEKRPAGPARLPPQARLDRSTPDDRVRRPGVSHWIETTTGWSIKKFVRTARRYRTITIQVGAHTITAADPLPDDLRIALAKINTSLGAH
jgi:hypothetical protein